MATRTISYEEDFDASDFSDDELIKALRGRGFHVIHKVEITAAAVLAIQGNVVQAACMLERDMPELREFCDAVCRALGNPLRRAA